VAGAPQGRVPAAGAVHLSFVDGCDVAQVSNLLYRRASSLHDNRMLRCSSVTGRLADRKSAIQQFGNLRYFPGRLDKGELRPRGCLASEAARLRASKLAQDGPDREIWALCCQNHPQNNFQKYFTLDSGCPTDRRTLGAKRKVKYD